MGKTFVAALAMSIAVATPAMAGERCRVMDPTGTPLNVRAGPNGEIVGALPNGVLVAIVNGALDAKGKPWVEIKTLDDGQTLGWVFREFIACF